MKEHFNTKHIIGKKFGKLKVIKINDERGNLGQLRYDCICECGKKHTVTGESLRSGKSKSCGCFKKGRPIILKDNREEVVLRNLFSSKIRKRVRNRNLDTDLSFEDFKKIILSPCYYCGIEGSMLALDNHGSGLNRNRLYSNVEIRHNGVDRKDSNIGYTKENSVSCCARCNCAKNIVSEKEFYNWIEKVYKFLVKSNRLHKDTDE